MTPSTCKPWFLHFVSVQIPSVAVLQKQTAGQVCILCGQWILFLVAIAVLASSFYAGAAVSIGDGTTMGANLCAKFAERARHRERESERERERESRLDEGVLDETTS